MSWTEMKRKLSSRKFWAALAGFVTSVLYALNWAETDINQAVGIIAAAGVLAAYIFAEGGIDAAAVAADTAAEAKHPPDGA